MESIQGLYIILRLELQKHKIEGEKMQIVKVNEDGYLQSPYFDNCTIEIEIEDSEYKKIATFPFGQNWRYVNGKFVLETLMDDNNLRTRRQIECFNVVDNRSQLWWDHLTDDQKKELNDWYEAWLCVTKTHIIPEKPGWLK